MRVPQFTGTYVVTDQVDKTRHIIQQVVGEDGTLNTKTVDDKTLFTVPDRFDRQVTLALQDQRIRYYTPEVSEPLFTGKRDKSDDTAIIRIDFDPENAPDPSEFIPMFTFRLMMRNPESASALFGQILPGENGHDVLELHLDRAVLEDALAMLEEMGAPVLGSEPAVDDETLRAKQADREQALRDARPVYKKILDWILRK